MGSNTADESLPRDFAAKLAALAEAAKIVSDVSAAGIARLVRTLHEVSFLQDEARYPLVRCWLRTPTDTTDPGRCVVPFDPPIVVDTQSLRRLAPSVRPEQHALHVVETQKNLCFGGIREIDYLEVSPNLTPWSPTFPKSLPGLEIRSSGPGHLVARVGSDVVALRGTKLTTTRTSAPLPKSLRDHVKRVAAEVLALSRVPSDDFYLDRAIDAIESTLRLALWTIVNSHHGGTLLVLPKTKVSDLSVTYGAGGPSLSRVLESAMRSASVGDDIGGIAPLTDEERPNLVLAAWQRWSNLRSLARTLANLSQIDGCVALAPDFRVMGFGARIHSARPAQGTCAVVDSQTGRSTGQTLDLRQLGTRHQSAAAFVQAHPKALAIVISQDGDVRVFHHGRSGVSVSLPFTPWSMWAIPF